MNDFPKPSAGFGRSGTGIRTQITRTKTSGPAVRRSPNGWGGGARTHSLKGQNLALCQLSYSPVRMGHAVWRGPQTARSGFVGGAFGPLYQPSGCSSSLVECLHDHPDVGPIEKPLIDDVVETAHFHVGLLCVACAEVAARLSGFNCLLKFFAE